MGTAQPARIRYSESSADISTVPSGLTVRCRPEKVCTDAIPCGARRRTQQVVRRGSCSARMR